MDRLMASWATNRWLYFKKHVASLQAAITKLQNAPSVMPRPLVITSIMWPEILEGIDGGFSKAFPYLKKKKKRKQKFAIFLSLNANKWGCDWCEDLWQPCCDHKEIRLRINPYAVGSVERQREPEFLETWENCWTWFETSRLFGVLIITFCLKHSGWIFCYCHRVASEDTQRSWAPSVKFQNLWGEWRRQSRVGCDLSWDPKNTKGKTLPMCVKHEIDPDTIVLSFSEQFQNAIPACVSVNAAVCPHETLDRGQIPQMLLFWRGCIGWRVSMKTARCRQNHGYVELNG